MHLTLTVTAIFLAVSRSETFLALYAPSNRLPSFTNMETASPAKEDLIYHAAASQLGGLKWNKDNMVTLPIGLSKGTGSAFQKLTKLVVAVQLVYPVKIQGDDCNRPAHSHRC